MTTGTSKKDDLGSPRDGSDLALAFVGSVVPDEPRWRTKAFSRAGNMCQQEIIANLKAAGLPPSTVLSVCPIPSFPQGDRFVVRRETVILPGDIPATLLGFPNATPFKQVVIGLSASLSLLRWGWRNRHARHRLVYQYNLSVPPVLLVFISARLIRAKMVVSLNDVNVPGQTVPDTPLFAIDYWLQRLLIPRVDGLVVVSDQMISDLAPNSRYLRVEGGIPQSLCDAPPVEDARQAAPSSHSNQFVIAVAGTLNEVNGIQVILGAFSRLHGNRFVLKVAGSGPLQDAVTAAARTDPRVQYLGMLPFGEVQRLYRSADVLVSMRLTKSVDTRYFFPSKMMEFLASGTPVLTTATGHVEAEFGSFVYLLKDESADGLAALLLKVSETPPSERLELGNRAREYVLRNKTWAEQGRRIARFCLSLFQQ